METKTIKVPVGVPQLNLNEVERQVPSHEPPPWPENSKLNVVGKRIHRIDARSKVTGSAKYTADIQLPGMLYARILRSPYPHAKVLSIRTQKAEAYPGVKAIHLFESLIGMAVPRDPSKDRSLWGGKNPILRYAGQPIAAVAAKTPAIAEEALALIEVQYETLPFVVDLDDAMKRNAPLVFGGPVDEAGSGGGGGASKGLPQNGNIRGPSHGGRAGGPRGNILQGFSEADVLVEGEFRTQVQTHCQLETNGIVADWKDDGLTLYISTQGTSGVRNDLAERFGLKKTQVRVITEYMGGGFGAKFGPGNYGIAAVQLSKKTKAPVKLLLNRAEQHVAAGNRPSTYQKLKIGAKRDGTLTAIQLTSYGTAGVALGAGVGWAAQAMYDCPNFDSSQYDVLTHAGPGTAFRAPGQPQGVFALDQLIDELSEKLKLDPLDLRDKIDSHPLRKIHRRIGAEKAAWRHRKPPAFDSGPIKRGIGMAQSEWGKFVFPDSSAEVRVMRDGSVEIMSSVQDLGTGIRTVLAQVVAEELGLTPADVTVRIGDTRYPAGPHSGGSVTTGSITPPVRTAAYHAGRQLREQVSEKMGTDPDHLVFKSGQIVSKTDPTKSISFKKGASMLRSEQISCTETRVPNYFTPPPSGGSAFERLGGVQFAEVTVDTEVGVIHVDRVVAVHSCGRPMNPLQIESQINGGVIQGLSWALYENRHMDRNFGLMMNADLEAYKIAGSRETPRIDIHLVEEYAGESSTDAFGIAEPSNVATAAAIANAFFNATGVRIYELPMTPDKVLAALERAKKEKTP